MFRSQILSSALSCIALLTFAACSDTSPTLLLIVEDPQAVAPTQLRIQIALEGAEALSTTRPEAPGAPLTSGQSLRVLLPDAAIGATVEVSVEALRDGAVHGQAQGAFRPTPGEELVGRVTLRGVEASACTPESCPDGCCQDGVCREAALATCGLGGDACVACDPAQADACTAGACRCGSDAPCAAGQTCTDGTCVSDAPTKCTSASDCAGLTSPGQCHAQVAECVGEVCSFAPAAAGSACDDGNGCNNPDACDGAGACVGAQIECATPPNTACFASSPGTCLSGVCHYQQLEAGTACSNGNACTKNEVCAADGSCGGGVALLCNQPPNNQCYSGTGTCVAGIGCVYTPDIDGSPCEGPMGCTYNSCQGGSCMPGESMCTSDQVCCQGPNQVPYCTTPGGGGTSHCLSVDPGSG